MMGSRMSVLCFVLLLNTLTSPPAFAARQQAKKEELAHDISVNAISIAVTVQDRKGRFINDLGREDFSVFENGTPRPITYFMHDFNAPASLTVLLDVSGSMALQGKLDESKAALKDMTARLLKESDEVSLLIFADGEVEVAAGFSQDKAAIAGVLDGTEAYGQTALNDAVAASPGFANRGKREKRALILITDGIENDSRLTPGEAVQIARKVDVPIYAIGYKIPLSERYLKKHKRSPKLTAAGIIEALDQFSRATGGKAFFVDSPAGLSAALEEILKELSHYYILGYTSYRNPQSEYRRIRVSASNKRFLVRTRKGY